MKRQRIQFIAVIVVLIGLLAATAGLKLYNKKQEEKKEAEQEAETIYVTQQDVSKITAFSYELNGEQLSFCKENDTWVYEGDRSLEMDESKIENMLGVFSNLTASEKIDGASDLNEYGLAAPSDTITFTTDDGITTIYVGNANDMVGGYYVKTGADDTVYLIDTSLASTFSKTAEDLTVEEDTTEEITENTQEIESTETTEAEVVPATEEN